MPEPLSRRAFIRVAAAIGAIGSVLGVEHTAQGQGGTPDAASTPVGFVAHDPELTKVYMSIQGPLYDCSLGCLRLHKYMSKKTKPDVHVKGPAAIDLGNDATSLFYSAALVNNVAANTRHVRDHIRRCEPIKDQDPWPEPASRQGDNQAVLWKSIGRWIDIELQLFAGILSLYPVPLAKDLFDKDDDVTPQAQFHDELGRLADGGVQFITIENTNWNNNKFIIEPLPAPPVPNSMPDSSKDSSLVSLELGFHKLVQAHMEIASFMPAHFDLAAARACAGGGGVIK
jgi:hypothetical protein